jgi:hypothetical protein
MKIATMEEAFSAPGTDEPKLARCLGGYRHAVLFRYQPDGAGILIAAQHDPESTKIPVGERFSLDDDGVGGADVGNGSGLIGLIDRVEALGGYLEISRPVGIGTSLLAKIPS